MIGIPFHIDMQKQILKGKKTATSRTKRYGHVGSMFKIEMIRIRTFKITSLTRQVLGDIAKYHYKEEGFNTTEEFIEFWKQIHPGKGYDPKQIVWYHEFVEVKDG